MIQFLYRIGERKLIYFCLKLIFLEWLDKMTNIDQASVY